MTAIAQPAAAALPAPKIRTYKPDALLYVTVAFMWLNVWRFQDLWGPLGKLRLPLVLELVLFVLLVTQTSRVRSWKWPRSKVFAAPLAILGLMLIGLPLNLYRSSGLTFILSDYVPTIVMFAALAIGIRERSDADFVAFAHLFGAVVYSLWVFKFVHITSDGRLGNLAYYDANDYGLLLVCAIPVAIYFARPRVNLLKRAFAIGALTLFVLMLIRSGSRGGFLGFGTVMALVIWRYRAVPKRIRYGAAVAGVLILGVFGSAKYWDLMQSILHPNEDYNTTSAVGRRAIWKRGVGYMLTHPVIGVGAAAFEVAEGQLSDASRTFAEHGGGFKWSTAHNSFVLVAAEEGVPGVLLFVSMIWVLIRQLSLVSAPPRGSPSISPADAAFAQAILISLVGFCVSGFFVSAAYSPGLYVLAGLGVAQLAILRRRANGPSHLVGAAPRAQITGVAPQRARTRVLRPTWTPAA